MSDCITLDDIDDIERKVERGIKHEEGNKTRILLPFIDKLQMILFDQEKGKEGESDRIFYLKPFYWL